MPRMQRKEFAVIGLGRFGASLALALETNGHYVLGIDKDSAVVQRLAERLTHVVALDSTDEDALRAVDITAFETVIVAIGTDFECNLLTTVALKSLGVRHVICKTVSRRQRDILLRVGADRVVLPEVDAGARLAEELVAPSVLERFHLAPGFSIAELRAPRPVVSLSLAQSNLRARYGVSVLVVKRGEQITPSPPADFILLQDDLLVVMGADDAIEAFAQLR